MHPTVLLAQGEGKHSQGHPALTPCHTVLCLPSLPPPSLPPPHSALCSAAEPNLPGSSTVIYNRVTSEPGTAQPPGTAKIAIK